MLLLKIGLVILIGVFSYRLGHYNGRIEAEKKLLDGLFP